jgi:very-short-patch-repair endonuclease
MPERQQRTARGARSSAKVRVSQVAARQEGRITTAQLVALGIADSTSRRWTGSYLFPVLPRVWAVGHPGRSEKADLFSAVLYAGPGAGLDGLTAALWRQLVKWRTAPAIEVATPRRCRSLPADHPENRLGKPIVVRGQRLFRRWSYHGIPTTPIPQIVLGLAAGGDLELVRFVLAQMDFMRILNEPALLRMCRRGVPGTLILREALGRPQPLFARARSPFEVRLIQTCELTGMRVPDDVNTKIGGITVDAVWWAEKVVVECDGKDNHDTWRQRRRDSGNDMTLRRLEFLVIRYTSDRLDDPWAVHADLNGQLERRRAGDAA